MPTALILREKAIGETRWVAFDASDRPIALRLERWSDADQRANLGDVMEARLRAVHERQGGGFVDLPTGESAFIRLAEGHTLTEGQMLRVQVMAEARRDKLARVTAASGSKPGGSAAERWLAALPGGAGCPVEDTAIGDPSVAAAFDEALSETVTVPGGGTLRIQPTSALIAADLDTAGRSDAGRAAARALRINCDAAGEFARQLGLRNLGGAGVLDCVSPINREAGQKVREVFLAAFARVSNRTAKALPPSAFGLLEVSVAWGETPIADRMLTRNGAPTGETLCLEGLRQLQREARAQSMVSLTLALPEPAFSWMQASRLDLQKSLDETYGARLRIISHAKAKPEVFPT